MWLANQRFGLRKVVLLAAFLQGLCSILRVIPCIFPSSLLASHGGSGTAGIAIIHIAQILNAASGPLVMATPTLLSQSWFGESERTTATAAAVLANNFGAAVGFVMAPGLVNDASQLPTLLYTQAGMGVLGLLLVVAYFPAAPPSPPTLAAAAADDDVVVREREKSLGSVRDRSRSFSAERSSSGLTDLWNDVRKAADNSDFMVGAVAAIVHVL
jgi:hypothetical protein